MACLATSGPKPQSKGITLEQRVEGCKWIESIHDPT